MKEKRYGFFTAVAMIVGIVIGSGVFFKSDDILRYTGGSVSKGILIFALAAVSIIFGSLSMAVLAERSGSELGVIGYAKEYLGDRFACAFGWFQTYFYFPALGSVVAWVLGVYVCMLLPVPQTLGMQTLIAFFVLSALFALNTFAMKWGARVQVTSMVVKLLPLFAIALFGLLFGQAKAPVEAVPKETFSLGWLAAVGPVAFSFDGWIISTSIAGEIEGRHLKLALILSPIFILLCYLAYFIGINRLIGGEHIVMLGDQHLYVAAEALFGSAGAKIMLLFIIVSVLGTVNGVVIGMIRLPYLLAREGMLAPRKWLSRVDKKTGTPVRAAAYGFLISALWLGLHDVSQRFALLPGADVSEIAIITGYFLYIAFYSQVFRLAREGKAPRGYGMAVSFLAIAGSLTIFFSGMQNPRFWICFAGFLFGMWLVSRRYQRRQEKRGVSD